MGVRQVEGSSPREERARLVWPERVKGERLGTEDREARGQITCDSKDTGMCPE